RRSGRRETRWPLASLGRFTLSRQKNRYGTDLRTVRLRFGRRPVVIGSLGWRGAGRPEDRTADFARFVRALAAEAARAAPDARFEAGGAAMPSGQALWWACGLI